MNNPKTPGKEIPRKNLNPLESNSRIKPDILRVCSHVFALLMCVALVPVGSEPRITFFGGASATPTAPTTLEIPASWIEKNASFQTDDGRRNYFQGNSVSRGNRVTAVCMAPPLGAGEKKSFVIEFNPSAEIEKRFQFTPMKGSAEITVDRKPFANFLMERVRKPVLSPLFGPNGEAMTQFEPADHIHHRSFWFTHGNVNGHDFWSELPRSGKTVVKNIHSVSAGPVSLTFSSDVDWLSRTGEKVTQDVRTYQFYRADEIRFVDFSIEFHPQTNDLVFGDDKEGTFGVRVPATMSVDQKNNMPSGVLVNAEGLRNAAVWGKKSPWCDYSGPVEGKEVGIAILDHPTNLRHPTTWHARTYGLFCANPFGLSYFTNKKDNGRHTVRKGERFSLKYRVILHNGDAQRANIAGHFAAFTRPPRAQVMVQ
jgi:hypothetical protein